MNNIKKLIIPSILAISLTVSSTAFATPPTNNLFPEPVDTNSWVLPEEMTWNDYRPIPGVDWKSPQVEAERILKGALVIVDFPDREFIISQPIGSELAGNPVNVGNISRDEIGDFWIDFLNKPQQLNNYRTIDEYWRENSYGKWGVELDSFGTYRMDHYEFQYGIDQGSMPPGFTPKSLTSEAFQKAMPEIEASGENYDFIFILHAGYDESGVWQEFGEMMFQTKEAITAEFGPPAEYPELNKWAPTRYVPWTSWQAAKAIWSHAGQLGGMRYSVQGENDGMGVFAHELAHILYLGDNYNGPYATPVSRTYSGPWELMSRGSFNGPGGPHTRWMALPTMGGSAPAHHMLRNKIKQGFISEDQYLQVNRDELANTGPVFASIYARSIPVGEKFGREGLIGINVSMVDLTPRNYLIDDWRADMQRGEKWYNNYTVEVVDRIGFDSFTPDTGVLLAKTKNSESAPNIWVIDSHPEDIEQVDFKRPDGTDAMYSKGDYRQLSDALFKAGTDENVVSEYKDSYNRLHFYILNKEYDEDGALAYRVAIRHMDGDGDFRRGVKAAIGKQTKGTPGQVAVYHFDVTNTGNGTDLYRLNIDMPAGWETMIEHNVIEVPAGETVSVPVYVQIPKGGKNPPKPSAMTFTSTSENDTTTFASVTRRVGPGNIR